MMQIWNWPACVVARHVESSKAREGMQRPLGDVAIKIIVGQVHEGERSYLLYLSKHKAAAAGKPD